jgi:hypothetical protein
MTRFTVAIRRLDYEALKDELAPRDRIVILSCDSCARLSDGLGGEEGLAGLADKLAADGFRVTCRKTLPIACSLEQLRSCIDDEANGKLFEDADVVIPLACQAGVEKAREALPGIRVLQVTETLGKGVFSPKTGAHLTEPTEDIGLAVDATKGISLTEAADRLGLHAGSF